MPSLQCRHAHVAAAFSHTPEMSEVVLFGGVSVFPPDPEAFVADTTVLRFGELLNVYVKFGEIKQTNIDLQDHLILYKDIII